jgi:hypothetical protein
VSSKPLTDLEQDIQYEVLEVLGRHAPYEHVIELRNLAYRHARATAMALVRKFDIPPAAALAMLDKLCADWKVLA